MKRFFALLLALALLLTGCAGSVAETGAPSDSAAPTESSAAPTEALAAEAVDILLDGKTFTCDAASVSMEKRVISGLDAEGNTEGFASDSNDNYYVALKITTPGVYRLSGSYEGQILVDLGEGAETDPSAVVTLLLDGADIHCSAGPAILFYRVYECAPGADFDLAPDLSGAGAVVVLADGSENLLSDSAGLTLHADEDLAERYDGALWSCQSLRLEGNDGQLLLTGSDNGLCAQGHLELNGGCLAANVMGWGVYAEKNGCSVVTVNGGEHHLNGGMFYRLVNGGVDSDPEAVGGSAFVGGDISGLPELTGGIQSDGAIVINGGAVYCSGGLSNFVSSTLLPQDGGQRISLARNNEGLGLQAERGVFLNGGTLVAGGACGSQVDAASRQQYMELSFASQQQAGSVLELSQGETVVFRTTLLWACSSLLISAPELALNVPYTLTVDGVVQQHSNGAVPIPGIGDDGPPDVEIPPQPTQPVFPASVEPTEGDADAQPPTVGLEPVPSEGQEPPEEGWVEITPIPGGSIGGGEITLPGFPVLIGGSTEFTLTAASHSFYYVEATVE